MGNNAYHAFLYSGGEMIDLGTLGGTNSFAYGIKDSGQVVGLFYTPGNASVHAFFYNGNEMLDLNTFLPSGSEWSYLESATDINEFGWITGTGLIKNQYHAFLMVPDSGPVPTPEPSTFILSGAGLAVIAAFRKKLLRKI